MHFPYFKSRNFGKTLFCLGFVLLSVSQYSCKTTGKSQAGNGNISVNLDTFDFPMPELPKGDYRASRTRLFDLLHTKLEVSFDWKDARLNGEATLTLKPYFYAASMLELDAKGFDVKTVSLQKGETKTLLQFTYDGSKIKITLDREYKRTENLKIYIEYTAKPEELETGGSDAITSDKGLYFINRDGSDKTKPVQIWTQGETESSSCWFPTIDAPNENMTQEIYITVDTQYVTLSNGVLVYSTENTNGTRTDYWKQSLPHAPYLAMMAIGKFQIVKDKWREIEVNYYMEPEFAPYAKRIFGNTPEMLEFYSQVLGVMYPWEKYSQIIVRDYVSGAMENTSAVIHGDFMNKTEREMIDGDNEDIVAHELFHHWFGDLVTCESWSNLPLNESFATYGEYLWEEHKYGRDAADYHIQKNLSQYLSESKGKKVNLIRFYYDDKEDMFDSHSYAKGGRILHMLRKYVGDEAFFEALRYYLERHKYTSVEIHQLRLAFEKVTGEDLNWFFNQWFLDKSHPELNITYFWSAKDSVQTVNISQMQDLKNSPLYKIPMLVDIYTEGKKNRHKIILQEAEQSFEFKTTVQPDLVNVDAEKMILCSKVDNKKTAEYNFQYHNAPLYLDRYEAIEKLMDFEDSVSAQTLFQALSDPFWNIRSYALKKVRSFKGIDKEILKTKLVEMSRKDVKPDVRAGAIRTLAAGYDGDDVLNLFRQAMNDSSYNVMGEALSSISSKNKEEGLTQARAISKDARGSLLVSVGSILARHGDSTDIPFFESAINNVSSPNDRYAMVLMFGKFIVKQDDETIMKSLTSFENVARNDGAWYMRLSGIQVISELHTYFTDKSNSLDKEVKAMKSTGVTSDEKIKLENKYLSAKAKSDKLAALLLSIRENEKDKKVLQYLGGDE